MAQPERGTSRRRFIPNGIILHHSHLLVGSAMQAERLSSLIGNVYDAALDPALWVGVLEQATRFVGGSAAGMYCKDVARKTANAVYQYGLDPGYVQLYMQAYVKLDPTSLG